MALGDVRPSNRQVVGFDPNLPSSAFGSGLAKGIRSMAEAQLNYEASEIDLKQQQKNLADGVKAKQSKIDRARADADLIRLRVQTSKDLEELRREWPDAGGRGYTDAATKLAKERMQAFQAGLPEDLREDYLPKIADFESTFSLAAFQSELSAGDAEYNANLNDVTLNAFDGLLAEQLTLEEALAQVDGVLEHSPFDEQTTQELADAAFESLQSAAYSVEIQAVARDPLSDGGSLPTPDPATGLYATGLPGVAAGLLTTVGGKESANQYDRIYNPTGVTRFDDFSDHPRQRTQIPDGVNKGSSSDAAGRYQFLGSTWDDISKELGLTDFSPASQDRAAWYYAQKRYKIATGQNIQLALESGDRAQIEKVRRVLSGEAGTGVVWEGLQKMDPEEFFQQVTGGKPTLPSAITDPRYADISYQQRIATYTDALNAESKRQAGIAEQQAAERNTFLDNLDAQIKLGAAGMSDILEANDKFEFTAVEMEKLNKTFETVFADDIAARQYQTQLASPMAFFDTGDAEQRKGADVHSQRVHGPIMAEQDAEAFGSIIIPEIQKTNYIPPTVEQALLTQMRSPSPETAEFAFQSMQRIMETNGTVFEDTFGDDAALMVRGYVGSQLRGQSVADYQAELEARRSDPEYFKNVNTVISKAMTDDPAAFSAESIANDVLGGTFRGATDFGSVTQSLAMQREFNAILRNAMIYEPNVKEARKIAVEVLKTRFGETTVGDSSGYITRRPPDKYLPEVGGSRKWVEDVVRQDLGLSKDSTFRLVADGQTEAEIARQELPAYRVFEQNEVGDYVPVLVEQDGQMLPARVRPDMTDEVRTFQITQTLLKDEVLRLETEAEDIRRNALKAGGANDEERIRLNIIEGELRMKQEELERRRREYAE